MLVRQAIFDHSQHQVRVYRIGTECHEDRDIVAFLNVARLHDDRTTVAQPLLAKVIVNRTEREQRRDRVDAPLASLTVADAQHVVPRMHGFLGSTTQCDQARSQRFRTAFENERRIQRLEPEHFILADLFDHRIADDR